MIFRKIFSYFSFVAFNISFFCKRIQLLTIDETYGLCSFFSFNFMLGNLSPQNTYNIYDIDMNSILMHL